jgi:hypothetical protein
MMVRVVDIIFGGLGRGSALNRSTVWKIVRDSQPRKKNALGTRLQSLTNLGTLFSPAFQCFYAVLFCCYYFPRTSAALKLSPHPSLN